MAEKESDKKEFTDLRMFKEEYIPKLKALGIESVEDLADALADESKVAEIHEHLKGVGPKTIEHWREELEVPVPEEGDEDEEEPSEEETEIEEAEEEDVEIAEDEGYKVKLKPTLSKETLDALKKRKQISSKRPVFLRQEWHRRQRLQGAKWRRPRGMHSKLRRHMGYRPNVVSIGYGGPKAARNLHPSGFQEVMVHNVKDLQKIDPAVQAARVAHTVGMRKRIAIEEKADEMKIRVLNRSG
ncbi:MAG TPA: 50S ribosomal protein L32e [Thermoplasmata archaeon]|nr:50S ribosomal protein L32e [Thermoplasmata archaeon]